MKKLDVSGESLIAASPRRRSRDPLCEVTRELASPDAPLFQDRRYEAARPPRRAASLRLSAVSFAVMELPWKRRGVVQPRLLWTRDARGRQRSRRIKQRSENGAAIGEINRSCLLDRRFRKIS